MSDIARWSYKNIATVWPIIGEGRNQVRGEPYAIACTWAGGGEMMRNNDGQEFVPAIRYWHEDPRVKYGDYIAKGDGATISTASRILSHVEYDMVMFDTNYDFMSVV